MIATLGIITEQDTQVVVLVYLGELRVTEGVITLHRYSRQRKPHGVALHLVELYLPQVGPMLE